MSYRGVSEGSKFHVVMVATWNEVDPRHCDECASSGMRAFRCRAARVG